MSWLKCMSFSKCPNLEAKHIIRFKLCHQRDKRSNYNLQSFKIHPLALEIYQLAQETFSHSAFKEKHKKTGEGLPCND